jgi:hypothetical protein
MRRLYKVTVNVMAMGMKNQLLKPDEWIHEDLTGCLQRYVVLQYERMIKYLILNTNNVAFQTILREHNFDFDFHCRSREIFRTRPTCPDVPTRRYFSQE